MNTVGIGEKLKQLRNERDMSMDNLVADLNHLYGLNLTKSMISRWESNKNDPSLTYVTAIVKYFNVSLDWLLGLTDKRTPPQFRKEGK